MKYILSILLLFTSIALSCQTLTKVSDLDPATAPDANDILYFEQDGVAKNITRALLLDDLSDSVVANILAIANLITFDDLTGFTVVDSSEAGDTIYVRQDGVNKIASRFRLLYDANRRMDDMGSEISIANITIDALQDSITALRTALNYSTLSSDFDTIFVSSGNDTVYAQFSGLQIAWLVDVISDPVKPYVTDAYVLNSDKDRIYLIMSEYMSDSVVIWSGGGGTTWTNADIVHAYNFDSYTSTLPDLVGSDNGTNSGATVGQAGIATNAWEFDGSDEVVLGSGHNYTTNNFTEMMWIYYPTNSSDVWLLGDNTNGAFKFGIRGANDGLWCDKEGSAELSNYTSSITLTENAWNHVVASYDQTADEVTFYIDGVAEVESWSSEFTASTAYIGSKGASGYFTGLIDDYFVFDDVVTSDRVDSIYNSGVGRRYNESGGGAGTGTADSIINAFSVSIIPLGGPSYAVDTVTFSGNQVRVNWDTDFTYGTMIRINYDKPETWGLRDTTDNYADSWNTYSVTNNINQTQDTGVFEIVWERDFEDLNVGYIYKDDATCGYDCQDVADYFGLVNQVYYNSRDLLQIVDDTINGTPTQAFEVTNIAYDLWHGWGGNVEFDEVYDELYFSFNFKFGYGVHSNRGGKFPGFEAWPNDTEINSGGGIYEPRPGYGFSGKFNFKHNKIYDYIYDRTNGGEAGDNPWSNFDANYYLHDSVYFVPGNWYEITVRCVNNTFSGSTPNADGILEVWVDGVLVQTFANYMWYDLLADNTNIGINGIVIDHYYGGDGDAYRPVREVVGIMDNLKVYKYTSDYLWGNRGQHVGAISTPSQITDKDFVYDTFINSDGPFSYSVQAYTSKTWLIDAGAGNTVDFEITSDVLADFLYIYDGETTDSELLLVNEGNNSDIEQTVTSTQRYMFIHYSTEEGYYDLTGTLTFN